MKKLSNVVSAAVEAARYCVFDFVRFEAMLPVVTKMELYLLDPEGMFVGSDVYGYYSNANFTDFITDTFKSGFAYGVTWLKIPENISKYCVRNWVTNREGDLKPEVEQAMHVKKPMVLHSEVIKHYPILAHPYSILEGIERYGVNSYRYVKEYDRNHDPIYDHFALKDVKTVVFENKLSYTVNVLKNKAYHENGKVPDVHLMLKAFARKIGCPGANAITTNEFVRRSGLYEDTELSRFSIPYDVINAVGQYKRAIFCLIVDGREKDKYTALINNMRECDRILVVHTDFISESSRDYYTEVMTPASYRQYLRGPMDNCRFDGAIVVSDGRGGYEKLYSGTVDKLSISEQSEPIDIRELYNKVKDIIIATDPGAYADYTAGYLTTAEVCQLYLAKIPELVGTNWEFNRLMLKAMNWLESNTEYSCSLTYKMPEDSVTKDAIKYADGMLSRNQAKEWDHGKKSVPAWTANYKFAYRRDKIKESFNYSNGRTRKAGNFDVSNFDLSEEYIQVLWLLDVILTDKKAFELYKKANTITCSKCGGSTKKDPTGNERYVEASAAHVRELALKVVRSKGFGANETIFDANDPDAVFKVEEYFREYLPKAHEIECFCHICGTRFWVEVDTDDMVNEVIDPCDNYSFHERNSLHSDDSGDFEIDSMVDLY